MSMAGKMRIAVLGPGGVGGLVAALLARKGNDVICIASDATVRAIAENGLSVKSAMFGEFKVSPKASARLEEAPDLLIIAVKATALKEAVERAPPGIVGKAIVMPLLNGIEHMEFLRGIYGANVLAANISVEAMRNSPSEIAHSSQFIKVEIGRGKIPKERIGAVKELLEGAGIEVKIAEKDEDVLWGKLVRLNALACTTAASERNLGFVRSDRWWRAKLEGCAGEAAKVASAHGFAITGERIMAQIDALPAELGSSMQRDVRAGKEPELDAIPGAIVRAGKKKRIGCPTIAEVMGIIKERIDEREICAGKKKAAHIGLIPARAGSQRVPSKNILPLNGHPLIAYSIASALESGIYDKILVSTDSELIRKIAVHYGADAPFLRPAEYATSVSPDIEWIRHALGAVGGEYRIFSILRPTSPFRTAETIRKAWARFISNPGTDSIRAVEMCKQHPGKMWVEEGAFMRPVLEQGGLDIPWHEGQYQALPKVYVQNSSMEIAWVRVMRQYGLRGGKNIAPLFTDAAEGFSIDYKQDFQMARMMVERGEAALPTVKAEPYKGEDYLKFLKGVPETNRILQ